MTESAKEFLAFIRNAPPFDYDAVPVYKRATMVGYAFPIFMDDRPQKQHLRDRWLRGGKVNRAIRKYETERKLLAAKKA